jgi:hypothetical protein
VFLPEWPYAEGTATLFTSVMRWHGFKEVAYNGVSYGQRDKQFAAYLDLPKLTEQKFRIAQMGIKPELLTSHGWESVPGEVISRTPESYREFIQQSKADFSVPKNGSVKMRGGWFSDRSVCYLAAGRPVLMEDTGLRHWLPADEGLITFTCPPEAVAGITRINADYERHRRAARRLAENCFSTEQVLKPFLAEAMN